MFDEEFWEERYSSSTAVWSGQPNQQLVAEAADLEAGTAVDIGSGEGADALWLASRGWQVTAVDFSKTALQRGAEHAEAGVTDRVQWVHTDLTGWKPDRQFDQVSAQFMHLPSAERRVLYARLADAVAPGGALLIVGHDFSDLEAGAHRPDMPDLFFTAKELANALEPGRWDVLVAETRPRQAKAHEGEDITVHDAVLHARKRE